MANMDEEWLAHLGAGLLLSCFEHFEQALSSLILCHQLAFHSDQTDQCRVDVAAMSICEVLWVIFQIRGIRKAYRLMVPHFQIIRGSRFRSARAWSALFVGWTFANAPDCYKAIAEKWLNRSLNLAADSLDDLCYIECMASHLIYNNIPRQEPEKKLQFLKMWKNAAAVWGNLDEQVWSQYRYALGCSSRDEIGEMIQIRDKVRELVGPSDDTLLQSLSDSVCALLTNVFGQREESVDYGIRVMDRLELPGVAATSWSCYFCYCAAPKKFRNSASPTRDLRLVCCLEFALASFFNARVTDVIALRVIATYKRLLKVANSLCDTESMKWRYFATRCHIYTRLCEFEGKKWYDRAESVLAETLKLSVDRGSAVTYFLTLTNTVELAEIMRKEDHIYCQCEDDYRYFELMDSLLAEVERLARANQPRLVLAPLMLHASILFRMGKMEKVIATQEEIGRLALKHDSSLVSLSNERISYNDNLQTVSFAKLQAALISCNQPERALVWAERERAQDLLHHIKTNQTAKARALKESLMTRNDEQELDEIKSITREAGSDTVFVLYTTFTFSKKLAGICGLLVHWGTVKQGWFTKLEPNSDDYPASVQQITQKLCEKDCNEVYLDLQRWYELLILPFEEELEKITPTPTKLVIIPGKELSDLPFAALYKGPGEPFLIQNYAISYIPSIRTYSRCKQRGEALMSSDSKRKSALVIGNPATGLGCDLRYAESEALATKNALESAGFQDVKLLQRDQATKSAFLESLSCSDWVHYAGHAVVSSEYPRGALLLACPETPRPSTTPTNLAHSGALLFNCSGAPTPSTTETTAHTERDGDSRGMRLLRYLRQNPSSEVLTGDDIEKCGLDVRALVTVLSACESGLGESFAEGVLGLYRSLHIVGVPAVICSLWNLDDSCAMSFMAKLYERLAAGSELAIALQEVIVNFIDDEFDENNSVSNWAAFIISGSPEMKLT